jgi:type VI secretion system protein ImpF
MSRLDVLPGIQPSILDRLIDPESGGTAARRGYAVEQIRDALQRDLEDLLNTRQSDIGLPEAFVETHRSIMGYGLPDLTSLSAITMQQREEVGRLIEAVLGHFEPRLREVRTVLLDPLDTKDRTIRFRVEARLSMEPAPEVAFDTILELSTGHYSVRPSGE